jgi:site-specific recombinase XerD
MLEGFITYLEAEKRYSPLTVSNYRRDIEQFLAHLGVGPATLDPTPVTTIHPTLVTTDHNPPRKVTHSQDRRR